LGAEPGPLDAGLQLPQGITSLSSLLTPSKFMLGPVPSTALAAFLHSDSRFHVTSSVYTRDATERPKLIAMRLRNTEATINDLSLLRGRLRIALRETNPEKNLDD
jgi:hypothetical protein